MRVFCGIDWAEAHHDIALVNEAGELVAKRRIKDTAEGFGELLLMLAEAGDDPAEPIPVAIETPRGLLVSALRGTGRRVYAINPMAVARYRERHTVSRTKSDHVDAMMLANILRTDAHAHRPLAHDTDLARAIAVLARAQQDSTWRRTKASNELRSLLREYFPTFLDAFAGRTTNLAGRDARAVLALALTPAAAAKLSRARIATALRRGGRQRGIDPLAQRLHQALRKPQLHQPPLVEQTMGKQTRALKAYAGSAPVTRASGRSISITHRTIKNDRLAAAGFVWAFAASTNHEPARAHYQRRRENGDKHPGALRHLFNRMLGQLFHCLHTGQTYDAGKAFTRALPTAA